MAMSITMPFTRSVRRRMLGWAARRRGTPDLTTLQRFPASATYPIRRTGVDPVPELAAARDHQPVTRLTRMLGMSVWLVTSHEYAKSVLSDRVSWSNDIQHLIGNRSKESAEGVGGLGMTDDPDHGRLRRLLTPEFTRRRLIRLAPRIDAIVEETLDNLAASAGDNRRADLVPEFAFAIPFQVICELLGLPIEDRSTFHALGAARFDASGGLAGVFGAATESREFLIDAVARQRSQPGDGLIGALVRDHGDDFSDVELGGLADGVFLGGYETSASMLAMGTHVLMHHPESWEKVRAGTDADLDAVIEELLRFLCPVQVAFPRFARHDLQLGGQQVQTGDVVIVSLSGANRDPASYVDPETFSPRSGGTQHLAFGHGLHRCVGAELARMELRAALRGLTRRYPDLSPAVPAETLDFRELSFVHGLAALPVFLDDEPSSVGAARVAQSSRSANLRAAT